MVTNLEIYFDILNNLNKLKMGLKGSKASEFKKLKNDYKELKAKRKRNFIFCSERLQFRENELIDLENNFPPILNEIKLSCIEAIEDIKFDLKKSQLNIELKIKEIEFSILEFIIQNQGYYHD